MRIARSWASVSDWNTNAKEAAPHVNDGRPIDSAPRSLACGMGRFIRHTLPIPAGRVPRKSEQERHGHQPASRSDHRSAPGGIIIPDAAKEKPQRGEVITTRNGKVKDVTRGPNRRNVILDPTFGSPTI